jgi:hypothetical protein
MFPIKNFGQIGTRYTKRKLWRKGSSADPPNAISAVISMPKEEMAKTPMQQRILPMPPILRRRQAGLLIPMELILIPRPHGHVAHWNMFLRSSHRNRRLRM